MAIKEQTDMKVSVFGMGHVGTVTAVMLAHYGHSVYGVDVDVERLTVLQAGTLPFREPQLEELLRGVLNDDLLRLTPDGAAAVAQSDISLICVGTPVSVGGTTDLCDVYAALDAIAEGLKLRSGYHVVAIRSTVPPGVLDDLAMYLGRRASNQSFSLCALPEFLREGSAVADFRHPPWVVIGQDDARAGGQLVALFHPVEAQRVITDCKTAMLLKYACNAWHALKVAFANELGDVAANLGVNGRALMEIFIQDTTLNISGAYLRPGEPFGGSCLPKDLRALLDMARGLYEPVLSAVLKDNAARVQRIVQQALATGARHFGVVGLSFKAGTDDIRESPWAQVVEGLLYEGLEVRVYDPDVADYGDYLVDDFAALADWAECLVIGKAALIPDGAVLPDLIIDGAGR